MPNITTAQAAEILGVSVRTVHRMVGAGEIHAAIKLPGMRGAYVFDADEITRVKAAKAAA